MTSLERWLAALFLVLLPSCARSAPAPAPAPAPAAPPAPAAQGGPEAPAEVRFYALDCGRADIKDMAAFGDNGPPRQLVASCYLIRHPRGTLLWDTGISDAIAETKGGVVHPPSGIRFHVETPLRERLRALELTPADVQYVAFSHLHVDHAGNANLFPTSTWILQRRELEWATATPPPPTIDPALISAYREAKLKLLDGEADLFGDGAVRVVPTPGHTPGHQSLIVRLRRAGTLVISGDLCHTHGNWQERRVPPFNTDREESIRSMERIHAMIGATGARFVVQHEPDDLAALPRFPAYLD
ncbi:MBL fold metallo-hydrolase [Sorangium cellulosum]|uniref:MBL fold metallo-hydrolase n=1 Tax=Sorangium cellulosum TaxID=56 RepID=A0A2L0EUD3_SORCE|nr:N-acyl homoserine lactonase family protein [Sorangium cellulosum]AUX42910.1 MBL fold metallo-hydrolase [Sorangium cellulosum]